MAYQVPGKRASQGRRSGLGGNVLFSVITHCERRYRAGGIEEDVVLPVGAGGAEPGRQVVLRADREVQFEEASVAQQLAGNSPPRVESPSAAEKTSDLSLSS